MFRRLFLACLISIFCVSLTVADSTKTNKKTALTKKKQTTSQKIHKLIETLTPDKRSALEERLKREKPISSTSFGITFYKPTYILPFYYTFSPYYSQYTGETPNNQGLKKTEFKAQLSFKVPLLRHLIKIGTLYLGYTQLSFWQFYASSQYFRETNYEPELFLSKQLTSNWVVSIGAAHQSNGRGGEMERSWNRAYAEVLFSGKHWLVSVKPWVLIFKPQSSNLHNGDIGNYLGYGRLLLAYKLKKMVFSVNLRKFSAFSRGSVEADISFPIHDYVHGYIQYFNGYGQSLIEYNHRTQAAGIGITLSNWI